MKTGKINIAGKELTLYERRAKDVLDLADFLKSSQSEGSAVSNIFIGTQIIIASLKPNIEKLKWYQFLKKYRLKKIINYKFLINNLSVSELEELMNKVYLLEGIDTKKKVNTADPESKLAEELERG